MLESHLVPSLREKIRGCLLGGLIGDAQGAPAEGKIYEQIAASYGELTDFEGAGTDDTAIRLILIDAIVASDGHPRVDDFGAAFLRARERSYHLWWIPVKNMVHKLEASLGARSGGAATPPAGDCRLGRVARPGAGGGSPGRAARAPPAPAPTPQGPSVLLEPAAPAGRAAPRPWRRPPNPARWTYAMPCSGSATASTAALTCGWVRLVG
jgi:hypothetical protein